jgi:hypothetical protein
VDEAGCSARRFANLAHASFFQDAVAPELAPERRLVEPRHRAAVRATGCGGRYRQTRSVRPAPPAPHLRRSTVDRAPNQVRTERRDRGWPGTEATRLSRCPLRDRHLILKYQTCARVDPSPQQCMRWCCMRRPLVGAPHARPVQAMTLSRPRLGQGRDFFTRKSARLPGKVCVAEIGTMQLAGRALRRRTAPGRAKDQPTMLREALRIWHRRQTYPLDYPIDVSVGVAEMSVGAPQTVRPSVPARRYCIDRRRAHT